MTTETTIHPPPKPFLRVPNALSNSPSGDPYTGLGCFPLGHHTTPSEVHDLTSTLRSLHTRHLLPPISPSQLSSLKTDLAPLHQAQSFWTHHKRDEPQALAVHELLTLLDTDSQRLRIYTFPDSARLTAGAVTFWGLSDLCLEERTTYLYISSQTCDFAATVLHTFLSSRRISRLQCFLAEYVLADQVGGLSDDWELPGRIQEDVEGLGEEEVRGLRERLDAEGRVEAPVLLAKLAGLCEERGEGGRKPVWWVEEEGGGGGGGRFRRGGFGVVVGWVGIGSEDEFV